MLAAAAMLATTAGAQTKRPPSPEPNFAVNVLPRPCAYEGTDAWERRSYEIEGWQGPEYERYPGACQRLRFSYGPITIKPGQNDVLISPVTIEKPMQDGYITRFRPDLVRADGTVPPVEQVHLHHGTWLSEPAYGSGPFFAAGEEKTVAQFPRGYGMPIRASDTWLLLYMVHSAVSNPMEGYIVYDVDFVPKAKGDELGMKSAYPVWLDVRPTGYPVFNVQRGFGGSDAKCTWPKEECAKHDPFGKVFEGQGKAGNGKGTDYALPAEGRELGRAGPFTGGTLIGIGGHMHPGGIQNEIDLVRPGQKVAVRRTRAERKRKAPRKTKTVDSVRIYTGRAQYWDRKTFNQGGGPPTSWDFSMPVIGAPYWGIHVRPGDALRSNVTYDTKVQSTYENMGIAVTLFVPNGKDGKPQAPGVDPFRVKKDKSNGCQSGGLRANPRARLCDKGAITHGHLKENENFGGARGEWNAGRGMSTADVGVFNFLYEPGDLSTISMTGVPTVKLGSKLRFTNLEGGPIYHTATSCAFPCLGPTGAAFPLSDGQSSKGRQLDFDSSEMGVGIPAVGPAKQALDYQLPITREEGFAPGEIVTYFCRIHPSMRGAFEVTE